MKGARMWKMNPHSDRVEAVRVAGPAPRLPEGYREVVRVRDGRKFVVHDLELVATLDESTT